MSTTKGKSVVRYCEGRTRSGKLCKLPAGHNTSHVGRGRCALHGGATPNHEKKAAREEAADFIAGQLGHEIDIDPLDGALTAVRMAAGAVAYWKGKLREAYEAERDPTGVEVEGYRVAMQDLGRMSDVAAKAGVAEKLIAITERMAEQIALAFEEAAQEMKLTAEQRARGLPVFGAALLRLEDGPTLLNAGDTE